MASIPTAHQRTLLVISDADADISVSLDALVADGTISRWDDHPLGMLRNLDGQAVPECPLASLSVTPSDEDRQKAERFWHGAVERDGSMSEALLSIMRMDDAKRDGYVRRYKDIDRYVLEMCSLHADAVLLPDGRFESNDGMRGCNQLHDWNAGFCDRFVRPLLDGDGSSPDNLVARMLAYEPKAPSRAGTKAGGDGSHG